MYTKSTFCANGQGRISSIQFQASTYIFKVEQVVIMKKLSRRATKVTLNKWEWLGGYYIPVTVSVLVLHLNQSV